MGVCGVRVSLRLLPISYLNPTYHHLGHRNHDVSFLTFNRPIRLISVPFNIKTDGKELNTNIQYEVKSEPLLVSASSILTHLYWCLEAIDTSLINGANIQPFLPVSASSNTTEPFCLFLYTCSFAITLIFCYVMVWKHDRPL